MSSPLTTPGNRGTNGALRSSALQFVWDNGKRNDYARTKVLSPYLKGRGMLQDAGRLREYGFTGVSSWSATASTYDSASLAHAATLHTSAAGRATLAQLRAIVVNDGPQRARPLIECRRDPRPTWLHKRSRAQAGFEPWRHPAGGKGVIFGWEIRRRSSSPTTTRDTRGDTPDDKLGRFEYVF